MRQIKNFKSDPLILDGIYERRNFITVNNLFKSNRNKIMFNKTLNLYSALVKANDFRGRNAFSKIAFVGGKSLDLKVKKIIKTLPIKLKENNYFKLIQDFYIFCGKKLTYQKPKIFLKSLKKWQREKRYPLHFLRFITIKNQNQFIKILKNIECVTSMYNTNHILLPKNLKDLENQKLGYIIGCILGDGYLLQTDKDYRISIADGSSHKEELKDSYKHLKNIALLFKKVLGVKKIAIYKYKKDNHYYLSIESKNLTRFLNFFFDIPYGKKKNKIIIPSILRFFKDRDEYKKVLFRGLFDSDAMVHPSSRNIEFASSDIKLVKECKNFLSKFGISVKIMRGKDKKGFLYYYINIKSTYFKKFAYAVGSSHPRKQRRTIDYLKKPLKYYIFNKVNKRSLLKNGNFNLKLMKKKDKRVVFPKRPNKDLIQIAEYVDPKDWEKARVYFRTKYVISNIPIKGVIRKFKHYFNINPSYLKTRNLYYVSSRAINEFFNLYFIYKHPWEIISENEAKDLTQKWNNIFKDN